MHGLVLYSEGRGSSNPTGQSRPFLLRELPSIERFEERAKSDALAVLQIEQGSKEWRAMVLWILLLGSYPTVWRRLYDDPSLVERLKEAAISDTEIARFVGSDMYNRLFEKSLEGRFAGTRLDKERICLMRKLMPQT